MKIIQKIKQWHNNQPKTISEVNKDKHGTYTHNYNSITNDDIRNILFNLVTNYEKRQHGPTKVTYNTASVVITHLGNNVVRTDIDFDRSYLTKEQHIEMGRWLEANNYPANEEDWSDEQTTLFNLTWR